MATYAAKGDRLERKTIKQSSMKAPVASINASGTAPGRGLSPGLWGSCPVELLKANPQYGSFMVDDFVDAGIVIAANQSTANASALGTTGNWTGFTDSTGGSIVTTLTDNIQGVVKLSGTTINEGATIAYPKTTETAGRYKLSSGTRLWMEARVSFLNITTLKFGAFIGFAEEALLATGEVLAASTPWALTDKDYVGFTKTNAATTSVASIYNTASGSTSPATVAAAAATIEADTFTKIGMYCDGTSVWFYQDGIQGTGITIATADFPDDIEMGFYAALMLGHGDAASISLDWVAIAQAYSITNPLEA